MHNAYIQADAVQLMFTSDMRLEENVIFDHGMMVGGLGI